jgi:hypothetical protein
MRFIRQSPRSRVDGKAQPPDACFVTISAGGQADVGSKAKPEVSAATLSLAAT